jgi:diadenosine tetraphosphate (Ap4A) HIT family hydrolase
MPEPFVNIQNGTRTPEYTNILTQIEMDAVCPFCPDHLRKYHKPPIVKEGTYWVVTPNMYPYENALHHLLFIARRHVTDTKELTTDEWAELHVLIQWIVEHYPDIDFGTFIMRTGDTQKTGATVKHLHAQFVVGGNPDKPVITRVG